MTQFMGSIAARHDNTRAFMRRCRSSWSRGNILWGSLLLLVALSMSPSRQQRCCVMSFVLLNRPQRQQNQPVGERQHITTLAVTREPKLSPSCLWLTSSSSSPEGTELKGTQEIQQGRSKKKNKKDSSRPPTNTRDATVIDKKNNTALIKLAEMVERDARGDALGQAYCDNVLGMCVASNEWDSVLDVLEVMKHQDLSQERSTYRACLKACFEVGNGASAKEILNAMKHARVEPDPIDVSLVVAAMCRNDVTDKPGSWWRRALTLLKTTADQAKARYEATAANSKKNKSDSDDMPPDVVPVDAYDAVLTCMVREQQWKEALRLLNRMEEGFHPSQKKMKSFHPTPVLSTYHAVIENCVAAGQAERAVQVLLSMPNKGIQPNVYTFEMVISALAKRQQWRRALQLLDVMDDMNIPQTTVTYNTVINACARAGEVGTAKNLLMKMRKKRGISPNIISFNSLMTACASTARWRDALSLLDQCHREPGVEPDIITYTNAIRACSKGRNTRQALALLDVIKDKGLPIDVYCYTAVIDACAKGKMWRRALDLLDEMRQKGISPNSVTYSVAIAACGNGGQWERALELLHQMREKGMQINVITYNNAISALSKAYRYNAKQASRMKSPKRFGRNQKEDEKVGSDEENLWLRALELLEQMKADGIEPDGFSYSAAISACGSGGRWKEALELIKVMQAGGPRTQPNKIAYTSAISACGRSGEWEHAVRLFTDMKNRGLQPDRVAYNALVSAFRVSNQADKAYEIWEEMCGKRQSDLTARATATADASTSPDIITLTDVIATLSRSVEKANVNKVDQVFAEAVRRGIVLRGDSLDSMWEVDLSGMSLPVARAACRYILRRASEAAQNGEPIRDVSFITGVGKGQRHWVTQKAGNAQQPRRRTGVSSDADSPQNGNPTERAGTPGTTALREYVRQVLREDLEPPVYSTVPKRAQGTVEVKKDMLQQWIDAQSRN